ncbi:hypothetical protein MATL_G00225640 [Megalops atlanticus]|uniref:TBC1 domain family member 2A n=1 Tax=Megalops atlanticus TaxID=7932 RepID=A0A9D3PH16_MEGAT|nr:hypothetical protein MATL_G00225640 [Megalops atlanticus]
MEGQVTTKGTAPLTLDQKSGGAPRVGTPPRGEEPPTSTKLCGYLQKMGGPLKSWKSRWFTYEDRKCQLFYYRTAQDVNPLGRIELADATFGYPLQADEGTFHIQTPERTFILKALNREAMMYWLQQLQLKRWRHRGEAGQSAQPCTNMRKEGTDQGMVYCTDDFLPTVKTPTGLVGEEAARHPAPRQHATLTNVSFKHPLTEIQNSVHSLRWSRSSQELSRSVFHWDLSQEPPAPTSAPDTPAQGGLDTSEPPTPVETPSPRESPLLLAERGREVPAEWPPRPHPRKKSGMSATMPADRKEASAADRTSRLRQEVLTLAEEVKAQKELVCLLHRALEEAQREKRAFSRYLSAEGERERLELLRHGERHAAELEARAEALRGQREELRRSLAERDTQVAELQEHARLMAEKNHAKQEVVLQLSEQVAACMDDPRRAVSNSMGAATFRQLQEEIENLKDDIEAYKMQNKFLNSEIYQLTRLWRNSSEQEKSLMMKCAYLEAKNCQTESRYLGVLRDLQESRGLDGKQQEVVKRLIEEALQADVKDGLKLDPVSEYDEYGFKTVPDFEVEDVKLLAKIQALEIRTHNLLRREAGDKALLGRWAQFLAGRPSGELTPSPELKALLRAGAPREYRREAWRCVTRARTRSIRDRHPGRYQELSRKAQACPHPASRQIQLDLHRTLTSNQRFASPSGPAVQQLHRILLAFSWQNPAIGYCQGLNRLAAIALLVLQNEEDAFWCLVAVVDTIMPQDYYSKTLTASQADQRVLKDFMAEKLPRLSAHFEELQVDVSLITFNWFLVVFVESLASNILLQVWDAFLYEGTKVLFRYALALFKYKEEDFLKIRDKVEMYQYLRFFTKTISDSRKLMSIAFNDMNPFPMKQVQARRALHLERLRAELRDLERIQREFVTESAERKDKDLDTAVSEDEDDP